MFADAYLSDAGLEPVQPTETKMSKKYEKAKAAGGIAMALASLFGGPGAAKDNRNFTDSERYRHRDTREKISQAFDTESRSRHGRSSR